METCLALSPEEAQTYSQILEAVSRLPKSDPRYGFVIAMTWWLLHRRRRLEQQRNRRRQFYRRWRRMLALRWQLQRNILTGMSVAMKGAEVAEMEDLDDIPEKRVWMKTKDEAGPSTNGEFWSQIEKGLISDEEFHKSFHMSKETFEFLYSEIEDNLSKESTTMREPIHGKKRLAATVFRLASNTEYAKVSIAFGIGKSTITSLIREVCEVMVTNLKDKYLSPCPGQDDLSKSALEERLIESEEKFEIPQCVGVLGSTDVLTTGSSWECSESSTSTYTKAQAVVFQAAVNDQGLFLHVSAGSPSSSSNAAILEKSNLKSYMEEKFKELEKNIDDVKVPAVLLAYDCSWKTSSKNVPCILTPFKSTELESDPQTCEKFNDKIDQARNVFDQAVVKLRSRFRIFHGKSGKISFTTDAFENIATACAILHNICEIRNEDFDPTWTTDVVEHLLIRSADDSDEHSQEESNEENMEVEGETHQDGQLSQEELNSQNNSEADEIRNILAYACCTD